MSVHLANEDPSRNITRAEGQNITLKCRADARPPVTSYGWFKNVSYCKIQLCNKRKQNKNKYIKSFSELSLLEI